MGNINSFDIDSVLYIESLLDTLSITVSKVTTYHSTVDDTSGKLLYVLDGGFSRILLISGLRYNESIANYGMVKIRSCIVELSNIKEFNKLLEVIRLMYKDLEVMYNRKKIEEFFNNE